MSDASLSGSCLCGDVAWQIDAELKQSHACHCTICRKLHGTGYGAYATVVAEGFRFVRGADLAKSYASTASGRRWFCPRCGSVLPEPHTGAADSHARVGIPLGTLDAGGPELRMRAHIFVASKLPWLEITDALPRFDAWPPGFELTVHPTPARGGTEGVITGSCLCDRVGYALSRPPAGMRHCHCSRCRKARAAPHATNAYTDCASFRFTRGEDELTTYRVPEAQFFTAVFCRTCSAPMPRVDESRDLVVIPGGSFDDDPGVRPGEHIFVGSKAAWFEISDALPQHVDRRS
jgi:hypothetical protein